MMPELQTMLQRGNSRKNSGKSRSDVKSSVKWQDVMENMNKNETQTIPKAFKS